MSRAPAAVSLFPSYVMTIDRTPASIDSPPCARFARRLAQLARLASLTPPLGAGAGPLLFPDFLQTPGSTNSRFSIQPSWYARFLLQPINSRIPITPASANIAAAVRRNVLGVQCPTPAFAQPRSMVFLMNFRVTGLSCLAPAGVNNTYLLLRPLSARSRHSSTRPSSGVSHSTSDGSNSIRFSTRPVERLPRDGSRSRMIKQRASDKL